MAGVNIEDRQYLFGHKLQLATTHHSAADLGRLIAVANRVLDDQGLRSELVALPGMVGGQAPFIWAT